MKTVLVTGGCGFIGGHFIRRTLADAKWRIVNVDKLTYAARAHDIDQFAGGTRYRFVKGDICDRRLVDELLRDERPWVIVNFAAESHVDRSIMDATPFVNTNVGGVQVLLEGAKAHGIERFVQISTDEVYGDASGTECFAEDGRLAPSSPYAATKAAADLLCLAYIRTHQLPIVIARSSNNYGPYQFPEKLIPLVIRNILTGKSLPVYGDGLQRRDWLYVDDNVDAICAILERGRAGTIYNIAAGAERTNLDVVQAVRRLVVEQIHGMPPQIEHVADRPGHDRRYAIDARRAREELGWLPQVSFETGLDRTVRWYLDHAPWIEQATSGEYTAYYQAVYTQSWKSSS